jgi:hypothetical protein
MAYTLNDGDDDDYDGGGGGDDEGFREEKRV